MRATKAFAVGRYGPKINPTGAHVLWNGRLWDVIGATYRDLPAGFYLTLRTFNHETTVHAPMSACEVLERDALPSINDLETPAENYPGEVAESHLEETQR